jgi:hypothetical protein
VVFLTFFNDKIIKTYKCNRLIGFIEAVYQEALEIELKRPKVPMKGEIIRVIR